MSGIVYKCNACNNILGSIGDSNTRKCNSCDNEQKIGNDRLISVKFYGEETKIITPNDVKMLGFEKTTKSINYPCPDKSCKGDLMSIVHDDNLVTSLFCKTCTGVFQKK